MTTAYHPQGNGINESHHRILEHAVKTRFVNDTVRFHDIVADSTVVANCMHSLVHNRRDTYRLTYGVDCPITGFQDIRWPDQAEGIRQLTLQELRQRELLN
eukprot:Trichotokara_eunicae@DN9540_c0_g1_i2.p1